MGIAEVAGAAGVGLVEQCAASRWMVEVLVRSRGGWLAGPAGAVAAQGRGPRLWRVGAPGGEAEVVGAVE